MGTEIEIRPWIATVRYRSRIGEVEEASGIGGISIEYALDDPGELAVLIKQGPGWGSLLWVHLRRSEDVRFPAVDYEDLPVHENVSVIDALA